MPCPDRQVWLLFCPLSSSRRLGWFVVWPQPWAKRSDGGAFLLPRLIGRFGFSGGCLISGCIWALWHYPALLLADYNSGTPKLYALICFTMMVIATAFLLGWLRLRSRSLWPCAVLHASHNLFIQAIFDALTRPDRKALYVTTEFGFGLATTIAVTAFYLIRKHPLNDEDLMHQQSALVA